MTYPHLDNDEIDEDAVARAESLRDPSRTRKEPKWVPPVVLDRVLCRGNCGALVEWTEDTEAAFRMWNAELAKRDEFPLEPNKIIFCEGCRRKGREFSRERNDKAREIMARNIRELKAAEDPGKELTRIKRIEALGHPDVPGLIEAIRTKRPTRRRTGDVL